MKRVVLSFVTIIAVALWSSSALSGERELYGALAGAGSGAVIGHAIGGNAESALIGSAIGGALGITIVHGGRHDQPIHFSTFGHYKNKPYHHRHHKRHGYHRYHNRFDDHRYYRYHNRYDDHRYHHRHFRDGRDCRTVKHHTYKYGHRYTIKKIICRDDRGYGGYNRGYFDRRDYRRDHHFRN